MHQNFQQKSSVMYQQITFRLLIEEAEVEIGDTLLKKVLHIIQPWARVIFNDF